MTLNRDRESAVFSARGFFSHESTEKSTENLLTFPEAVAYTRTVKVALVQHFEARANPRPVMPFSAAHHHGLGCFAPGKLYLCNFFAVRYLRSQDVHNRVARALCASRALKGVNLDEWRHYWIFSFVGFAL